MFLYCCICFPWLYVAKSDFSVELVSNIFQNDSSELRERSVVMHVWDRWLIWQSPTSNGRSLFTTMPPIHLAKHSPFLYRFICSLFDLGMSQVFAMDCLFSLVILLLHFVQMWSMSIPSQFRFIFSLFDLGWLAFYYICRIPEQTTHESSQIRTSKKSTFCAIGLLD